MKEREATIKEFESRCTRPEGCNGVVEMLEAATRFEIVFSEGEVWLAKHRKDSKSVYLHFRNRNEDGDFEGDRKWKKFNSALDAWRDGVKGEK